MIKLHMKVICHGKNWTAIYMPELRTRKAEQERVRLLNKRIRSNDIADIMIRIKVSFIPLFLDHLHDKLLTLLVTHPILATISCSINQSAWTARSFS